MQKPAGSLKYERSGAEEEPPGTTVVPAFVY
jgi:hypothetical protein